MINSIHQAIRKIKSAFRYRFLPPFVDRVTTVAMMAADRKRKAEGVKSILIDNTVLAHSVTHETAWVDTGPALWGNVEIGTGYVARIPVHDDLDDRIAVRSVRYLPGIANLARREIITLCTSHELVDETWTQPVGRFRGYGMFDHSLFSNLKLETLEDSGYSMVIGGQSEFPTLQQQRKRRLESKSDPLYRELISILGPKNSQDAWHITTAERNSCYCFLTMDFKLISNVRAQAKNRVIRTLRTKVLTPEEFGQKFSIPPIPPRLFSYHDASYPVIHRENWPNSERKGKG